MRQQRVVDVPKPPPIPDWFLKQNVRLVADKAEPANVDGSGHVIRCVDGETGHTLFTTPYYGEDLPQGTKKRRGSGGKKDPSFFARSFSEPQAAAVPKDEPQPGAQPEAKRAPSLDAMAWIFLEAEATARASLSLPQEQRTSSFAASRVDMSLVCPDPNAHDQMDELVHDLARVVDADVVRLDANDIEELTTEYVGSGQDSPGSFSTLGYDVFDGYEATNLSKSGKRSGMPTEEDDEFDEDEDEFDDEEDEAERPGNIMTVADFGKISKAFQNLGFASVSVGAPRLIHAGQMGAPMSTRDLRSSSSANDVVQWDDARLAALLDSLLDAPKQKRSVGLVESDPAPRPSTVTRHSPFVREASEGLGRELLKIKEADRQRNTEYQRTLRQKRSDPSVWSARVSQASLAYISRSLEEPDVSIKLEKVADDSSASHPDFPSKDRQRTIVHARDLKDICRSRLGHAIIRRLVRVVQKRRNAGESVLVVGTSAQSGYGSFAMFPEPREVPFRTMEVPPFFTNSPEEDHDFVKSMPRLPHKTLKEPAYNRILEINLRHVQGMLRRLRPSQQFNLLSGNARNQMSLQGTHLLTEKVLSLDHVQRLALTAIGLSQSHAQSETVAPIHIALATLITANCDNSTRHWTSRARESTASKTSGPGKQDKDGEDQAEGATGPSRVEQIKKSCSPHETRLLTGVVDSGNIKTGFGEVHAPVETIDALKTLTTLSLLRPEAFKYGVLANDRLPGLLLYGPPGTGKTLLAKAVAKESKATVLEVSGAQIYEKYVGEGEKMVRAVFSLAKKLSPCVVFIDEADAIFGSRSNAGGNRNTHREIINQFLREWDGMDDHGVFMMVATNRPFDLDDAVLRRLPRRLLVDLPVPKDRESILGIHLKNEALDASVSLPQLAEQTPLYSGSDLKNLCVAAALACVREENALAEQHKSDKGFRLPDKRMLTARHFEKAIAEISASISEDMSSLTAIRKFDEQYGDRRGRRKKSGYGFGGADAVVDESSVRVRSAAPPPP